MFDFQLITDKQRWEQFIASRPEANFLQSWNWGVFQQALGKKVFYLGVFDNNQQVGALLVVKEVAKRGNYLAIAGGPIIDWPRLSADQLRSIFEYLKGLAHQEKCLFIRFRPQALDSAELRSQLQQLGVNAAPMHLTADLTLQLDLTQSEEQILSGMRKNTRYEIRHAQRQNITADISKNPAAIQPFYEHQLALAAKHHFVPFSYQFLFEQFKAFATDDQVVLISSFQGEQLLATAFVIFYNGEAVYHYGISTPANDQLAGSYACQWTAIQEAKRRGCTRYNFWGIAPKDEATHRFSGVSLFKRGFGGQEVAYLPAHDLPTSPFYRLTHFFEKLRKQARHL
jgi:lipid II:glycine glycyltransferase (peptidoglycan interpeptide bridge formation enzyme)